ncbi:RHS repeat-associated core domain-containing protein [Stenotrophomonas sp. 278]|uniref:RHS repeat-associated core domain-containing protein n=1 Tax=Stenotrophomonas sp. 278 TaxID=2479851 RepID=UPI000F6864E7|nr:RHS repeat-associated core domain-containing protein [Stenotrophomonas sp. 278]RRU23507.1 RHS repeat-associated core domain-containing protein [Stenotrophomonas sp. 278]
MLSLTPARSIAHSRIGFNGQLHEPATAWQVLGNGHRAYNPVLMRFHSPDHQSPFGKGGVHAYAYCEGDPQNRMDPNGQHWIAWLGIGGLLATGTGMAVGAGVVDDGAVKGVLGTVAALSVIAAGAVFAGHTRIGNRMLDRLISASASRRSSSLPGAVNMTPRPSVSPSSPSLISIPPPAGTPRMAPMGQKTRIAAPSSVRSGSVSSIDPVSLPQVPETRRAMMLDDLNSNWVYTGADARFVQRLHRGESFSSVSTTASEHARQAKKIRRNGAW